jgi:hypothetical protein
MKHRRCNPSGKSQERRGRESLSDLVSTELNKGVLFHYQKFFIISQIHRIFIQGTTLLVRCDWTFEFLELYDVKSHHELKSRTASSDCWVPAQSSPIWSLLFIGKTNGHVVYCIGTLTSIRFHEVLLQLQSYRYLRVMIKSL